MLRKALGRGKGRGLLAKERCERARLRFVCSSLTNRVLREDALLATRIRCYMVSFGNYARYCPFLWQLEAVLRKSYFYNFARTFFLAILMRKSVSGCQSAVSKAAIWVRSFGPNAQKVPIACVRSRDLRYADVCFAR